MANYEAHIGNKFAKCTKCKKTRCPGCRFNLSLGSKCFIVIFPSLGLKSFNSWYEDWDKSGAKQFSFCIYNKNSRNEMIDLILCSIFDPCHYMLVGGNKYYKESSIIGYECIKRTEQIKQIFNLFHENASKIKTNVRVNCWQFLMNLVQHNILLIKHILSDSRLWKPLFLGILLNLKYEKYCYGELWMVLIKTVPVWKWKHYQYVIRHGIENVLIYVVERYFATSVSDVMYQYKRKNLFMKQLEKRINSTEKNETIANVQRFYVYFHQYCNE
eukprot:528024_1